MGLLVSGKNPAGLKTAERSYFTATAGQTTFTVSGGYAPGDIDVFMNGIRLIESDDYFATNGSTVVLSSAANTGDSIVVVCYYQFQATGHYTKAESDSRYITAAATTPLTSFLRTPNYGVSSTGDNLSAEITAAAVGQQGVGVKAYGRSMSSVGGDLHMIADSRGAGGAHRFYSWNGTSLTQVATIDSAGRMSRPLTPCFEAIHTSGGGAVISQTELIFNSVNINIGNHYNSSTGRFTAPISGSYQFFVAGMTQATTWLQFRKNGAPVNFSSNPYATSVSSSWAQVGAAFIVFLNSGEYVSVFNNGSGIYSGGNHHNVFNGFLLG